MSIETKTLYVNISLGLSDFIEEQCRIYGMTKTEWITSLIDFTKRNLDGGQIKDNYESLLFQ